MNRQTNKLVGQHASAANAGSAMIVVTDSDVGAGAHIVVSIETEIPDSAGVVVSLKMAANLVVAISKSVWKQTAPGIQQQASRLDGTTGDNYDVGKLLLQTPALIKVGHAAGTTPVVGQDLFGHALGAQFAVSRIKRYGDHSVLRSVFRVNFAGKSQASTAAHAWAAAVVRHAVPRHGNVKWMQAKALGRRFKNLEFSGGWQRRHG